MSDRRLGFVAVFALALCGLSASVACSDGYDWSRKEVERGTLGEELFKIWRKDAARSPEKPEARVEMLDRHEQLFVESVDGMAPPDSLGEVDQFFRTTNRSIDSGLLPSLTRKVRIGIENAAGDDALLTALAADSGPSTHDYLAASARPNLPVYVLNYDDIRPASQTLGSALLKADGVDAKGKPADDESTAFLEAQRALTDRLSDASSGESSPAVGLRDVLVREDGRLHANRDVALPAVRYDRRGLPRVTDVSNQNGSYRPVPPFVDRNGDGLADADSQGRFVLSDGGKREISPFSSSSNGSFERDDDGRALTGGVPAFEYVHLADTGLHWSVRQLETLHAEDVHWKLLDATPALLGDRVEHQSDGETYRGYSADQPLIDVLEAALSIFNFEQVPATLRSFSHLFDTNSTAVARLLDALSEAKSHIDDEPDAQLSDLSTIGYDLLPILEKTSADPDLWADVMDALSRDVVAETGTAMATMLKFRDLDTLPKEGGSYEPCFQQCKTKYEARATPNHPHGIGKVGRMECIRGCAIEELFTKKTDFDAPEARDNRSTNQQLFHLLRDTAGTPYKLEITQASVLGIDVSGLPAIVELPGSAEAFVRSVAGNLKIKNYVSDEFRNDPVFGTLMSALGLDGGDVAALLSTLSPLFGEGLSEEPTPSEITRLFNNPDLKFEAPGVTVDVSDPVCKDGYVMANHHADKLFASEASGLIDAVQPLAKAFSDHGREELFTALFRVIHEHYSKHDDLYKQKDGTPSPMKGAGLVSFEPALYEIARSGYLFEALHEFAVAVDRMKPVTGEPFEERLRQLVHHAVRRDRPSGEPPEGPDGERTLTLPDGTRVDKPSRMHFLIDSIGDLVARVHTEPAKKKKLQEALKTLTDAFLEVESGSRGKPEFRNPGTMAMLSLASRELADSAEEWRKNGTLDDRLTEDAPQAASDIVSSRMLAVVIDLLRELGNTEERRETIDGLGSYILSNGEGRDQLAAAGYRYLASSGTEHGGPIGKALARIIDPDRTWETDHRQNLPFLSHALTLVHRLVKRDENDTGFDLARRGLQKHDDGTTHVGGVGEVIGDYYRTDPPSPEPYSVEDYRRVFLEIAAWMNDDVHGLEQLYDIVGRRSSAQ